MDQHPLSTTWVDPQSSLTFCRFWSLKKRPLFWANFLQKDPPKKTPNLNLTLCPSKRLLKKAFYRDLASNPALSRCFFWMLPVTRSSQQLRGENFALGVSSREPLFIFECPNGIYMDYSGSHCLLTTTNSCVFFLECDGLCPTLCFPHMVFLIEVCKGEVEQACNSRKMDTLSLLDRCGISCRCIPLCVQQDFCFANSGPRRPHECSGAFFVHTLPLKRPHW